jgi:uncharacterized protein (TIGR02246 family)
MVRTMVIAGVLVAALAAAAVAQQAKPNRQATGTAAGPQAALPAHARQDDEKAIRSAAEAFAKAYNAGDAKTLASLFIAGGEIVNEEGESVQGQEAIERIFADIFHAHPKSQIKFAIQSIRFLGDSLAIEDGTTTVTHASDQPVERNRYTVVHAKQDGKWRMASARDLPDAPSGSDEIKQLAWMIGEWIDESPTALVITSYRWADEGRAIVSEFKVQVGGKPAMTGTQRIGWDPLMKKLHSWVFDSEGGVAEGVWTRSGGQWIIKMTGATHDGKMSSSTNTITAASKDRLMWQSRDRVVGDEMQPNIEPIPLVRQPPKPTKSTTGTRADSKGVSQ